MTVNVEVEVESGRVRAIPVPATSTGGLLIAAAYTLNGWSFQDGASSAPFETEGAVVAPAAGATIASISLLPAGLFLVKWQVQLIGAAAAADQDNFQLTGLSGGNLVSLNAGAAGQYQQPEVGDVIPVAGSIQVKAIGAGTAAVTYAAQITLEPVGVESALAQITSGQDIMGVISVPRNGVDTRWFSDSGILVKGDLNLVVLQGTVKGAVYSKWYDGDLRY